MEAGVWTLCASGGNRRGLGAPLMGFHEKECQREIKNSFLVGLILGLGWVSNNGIRLPYALWLVGFFVPVQDRFRFCRFKSYQGAASFGTHSSMPAHVAVARKIDFMLSVRVFFWACSKLPGAMDFRCSSARRSRSDPATSLA